MIIKVKNVKKIKILFENDVNDDFNIVENERQELIDACNNLIEILNIIKND